MQFMDGKNTKICSCQSDSLRNVWGWLAIFRFHCKNARMSDLRSNIFVIWLDYLTTRSSYATFCHLNKSFWLFRKLISCSNAVKSKPKINYTWFRWSFDGAIFEHARNFQISTTWNVFDSISMNEIAIASCKNELEGKKRTLFPLHLIHIVHKCHYNM